MSVENHIFALRRKHADLENQIRSAELQPSSDPLEIQKLKKQKLALKDEIAGLEAA